VAAAPGGMANYDVAPSEDLFVMVELVEEDAAEAGKMYLVLNWLEELSERVPVD